MPSQEGEYCSKGMERSRYCKERQCRQHPCRLPRHPPDPPPLTSSETAAKILSSPSTSCLKVGRCEGTACQHSRISMYLGGGGARGC